jgi:hypothetical protein
MKVSILGCFPWRFVGQVAILATAGSLLLSLLHLVPVRTEARFVIALPVFGAFMMAGYFGLNLLTSYEKATVRKYLMMIIPRTEAQ